MTKKNLTDSVYCILLILLLLAALLIWPAGLLTVRQEYKSLEFGMTQSGSITETAALSGIFQPVTDRLDSIGIRFTIPNRRENPGTLTFQLSDADGAVICTETVSLNKMQNNKYYYFDIPQKLSAGQAYIYQITTTGAGEDAPFFWLGSPKTACAGQASVYYSGQELPGNALIMRSVYHGSASFKQSLPYEITLLALAILLLKSWKGANTDAK